MAAVADVGRREVKISSPSFESSSPSFGFLRPSFRLISLLSEFLVRPSNYLLRRQDFLSVASFANYIAMAVPKTDVKS